MTHPLNTRSNSKSVGEMEPHSKPNPIDRNPHVQCHVDGCTNDQKWDKWQSQYTEITPKTTFRCPECWGDLIEQARIDKKRSENVNIEEYANE